MDSQRYLKQTHHPSSEKPNPFLRVKRARAGGGGETITYEAFPGTSQQVTFASVACFPIIIPAWHLPAAFVCDSSGGCGRLSLVMRVHRSPFSPQVTRGEQQASSLNFSLVLAEGERCAFWSRAARQIIISIRERESSRLPQDPESIYQRVMSAWCRTPARASSFSHFKDAGVHID